MPALQDYWPALKNSPTVSKVLLEDPTATVAIDVSEQPIERPVKNQKAYYSGKKTPYDQSPARDLPIDADYPVRGDG